MTAPFRNGFEKQAILGAITSVFPKKLLGKMLTTAFVGSEVANVAKQTKNFGNKSIGSMKPPSFYTHRRLPNGM